MHSSLTDSLHSTARVKGIGDNRVVNVEKQRHIGKKVEHIELVQAIVAERGQYLQLPLQTQPASTQVYRQVVQRDRVLGCALNMHVEEVLGLDEIVLHRLGGKRVQPGTNHVLHFIDAPSYTCH